MPTYEYACKSCGHHLEVVQSFSDDALRTCPECGGDLRKVFGNIAISFKGSGFYKNDSRSSSKPSGASQNGDSAKSSSESSSSSSSDGSSSSESPNGSSSEKSSTSTPAAKAS